MSEKTKKVKYKLPGLFFMSAFNDQTLLLKYKAFYNISQAYTSSIRRILIQVLPVPNAYTYFHHTLSKLT